MFILILLIMYKQTPQERVFTFRHFNRKGWSVFASLHCQVRIGVLSVATLTSAAPLLMAATPRILSVTPTCIEEGQEDVSELDADTLSLGEACVSVARIPVEAGMAARQVVTLSHEDLQAAGVACINDVLKLSAGVDVRQRGGFGIQTDIGIEGGSHDQITLLLNGVLLVNPQTGHNAADFPVNVSDIAKIEIIEGAASRVMGSQAFGGVINIITFGALEGAVDEAASSPLSAQMEAGSYGTVRGEMRTAWSLPQGWTTSVSGSYQRSDGAVRNSAFKGGKGFAQLVCSRPDYRVDLQAGVTANDFGANTFYTAAYPNQWEALRRYLVSAKVETKGRIHVSPQLSWVRSLDHYQLTKGSTAGENFHRTDVYTAGVNAWTAWARGRTAVGAELREEAVYSTSLGRPLAENQLVGIPGEHGRTYTKHDDRTNISYFAEHNVVWRKVTMSAGVMAERNNAIDARFRFYPGVDVSFRPTQTWTLYASWNKSLRLPTFTDLWYKSPTQEGNVGLRPEECSAFRVGADFACDILTLRLKAHYQRGTGMIDWVMYHPEDIYHATAFKLDSYGAGADVKVFLSRWWGGKQPFRTLVLSYAWTDRNRRAGEDYFKSNYALEHLRHKFTARLNHRIISHLSADWSLRVQQREGNCLVYENLKPTASLRPYGTHAILDCKLNWTARKYALYVDMTNLTNHRYYDLANVVQPGFMVLAGIRARL